MVRFVSVETSVQQAVTLATGEITINFAEQHKDGAGAPIRIPNLFLIAVPVFEAGDAYRIPVRLRYRLATFSNICVLGGLCGGPSVFWFDSVSRWGRVGRWS